MVGSIDSQGFEYLTTEPVSALSKVHNEKDIAVILQRLSTSDREILQRRFFAEQSIQEIATDLKIELSAAKMRLSRAKERFKTLYSALN